MNEKEQCRPRLSPEEFDVVKAFRDGNVTIHKEEDRKEKRYLVLGCVHVPFHNKKIFEGVLNLMEDQKFDGLVLAGDFLDMGALSTYERGKISRTGVTLEDEYNAGNEVLDALEARLPSWVEKVYIAGNHERRWWQWKADVDNNKYGDVLNPFKSLNLEKRGYKVYTDYVNDYHNLGSLVVMHGEYFNIHCAKKHLDVFRRNVLFFHTHRMQMYREGDFAGYNGGFLGDKKSVAFNYANRGMKSAWANGFAVVTLDEDENHHVELIGCVKDKFTYNGKTYGG